MKKAKIYGVFDPDYLVVENGRHVYRGGDVDLRSWKGTDLRTVFPDGTLVKGAVNLRGADVNQLPAAFTVDGELDISNTLVEEIPADLEVVFDLNICNTPIKRVPDNLKVGALLLGAAGHHWNGQKWLKAGFSAIEELPKGIELGEYRLTNEIPYYRGMLLL